MADTLFKCTYAKSWKKKGAFINHVDMAGGEGFTKCPYFYISHIVKLSTKGEGVSNMSKNCPHGL